MSNLIQIAGAVAIITGAIVLSVPVGLIVGGFIVVLIGISLEK